MELEELDDWERNQGEEENTRLASIKHEEELSAKIELSRSTVPIDKRVKDALHRSKLGMEGRAVIRNLISSQLSQEFNLDTVADRVLTRRLAKVPGMEKYIERQKEVRRMATEIMVKDEFAHGQKSRMSKQTDNRVLFY